MSEVKSDSEVIAGLAEEFVERYRRGERPPVNEYTAQHPELADEIREFFAAVAMVENLAPAESESFGDTGSDASSATLPALKRLGDFRIIREVGRGGMGVVYEAEQVSLGRHVALKVLPGSALPDDKHIKRFEREAKSAAKLHHTNIVPVFGVGTEDDLHYYVMQFIQGLPLDEVIEELKTVRAQPTGTITASVPTGAGGDSGRRRSVADVARSLMTGKYSQTQIGVSDCDADGVEPAGEQADPVQSVTELSPQAGDTSSARLSDTFNLSGSFSGSGVRLKQSGSQSSQQEPFTYWESVANIGLQVADAIQYAHEQGILHRDIKPSNLLLDLRGTAWVTDFGLAKATDQQDITHTGDILGTLRYMPPEAFEGIADARSDVYSLGLTLYELLCFQPAFRMKDRRRLVKQVTTESAARLEKLNPEIPRDLVTIIHKAIDRDPSHRYQNARELQEDLQRFVDDEPIKARRISTTERLARWSRRNKGLAASLAVLGLLLLIINIAGPVMTWRMSRLNESLTLAERRAAAEAARNKRLADEQTALATEMATLAELIALRPNDPLLLGALARHQAAAGRADASAASLTRARRLMEGMLAESPADETLAGFLADLLSAEAEAGQPNSWTVLEPRETASSGGATFERQPDGSIFVSGENPDADTYTLTAPIASDSILALRLELIPDDRLPADGSGRAANGNFRLAEFETALISGAGEVATPLPIEDAVSDFDSDLTTMWDGDPATYWITARSQDLRHAVVFATAPVSAKGATALRVRLKFTHGNWSGLNLGRFRLSVTNDPAAFETHDQRFAVSRIDDPWERLGAAYAVVGDSPRAGEWFARALEQAPDSAARLKLVERIDDLQTDLNDFLALRPDDPLLLGTLANRQAAAGHADAAAASLGRARSLTEALLAESPTDATLAGFLADLLLSEAEQSTADDRRFAVAGIDDPWVRLGAAYAVAGDSTQAAEWFARALEQAPEFAARLELVERIDKWQTDLSDLMALRPDDPVFEYLLLRRRFQDLADSRDEQLVAEFLEFLEKETEIDRRILYGVPEFRSVVDQDGFELLVERQLAESSLVVRQQVWARQSPVPFVAQWMRTRERLELLILQKQEQGLRPASLSATRSADSPDPYFVAIWTDDGRDHRIELALTRQEFDELLNTQPKDMQPVSVEEYVDDGRTLYAALWVQQTTFARWELHERLSESETAELAGSMQASGFRPTYVNTYPDGTLTTIWVENEGESELLLGLTYQDLQDLENERSADCLPVCMDSHFDGRRRRYSVIVDASVKGAEWNFALLVRESEFQDVFRARSQAGWNPVVTTESPVGVGQGGGD